MNRVVGQFFRSGFQCRYFYPDDKNSTEKYMLYLWPDTKEYKLTKLQDNSMRWSRDKHGKEIAYDPDGEKRILPEKESIFKTDGFAQTIIKHVNKLY